MRNFHCDAIFRRLIILVTLQTAGDGRKGTDIRLQNSSWNGTCLLPRVQTESRTRQMPGVPIVPNGCEGGKDSTQVTGKNKYR